MQHTVLTESNMRQRKQWKPNMMQTTSDIMIGRSKMSVQSEHDALRYHQFSPTALSDDKHGGGGVGGRMRWSEVCPLLVKHEKTTGWQPGGRWSGQHAGVLGVHVLHAHDISTYSALVYRVVKRWLLCHVVVRRGGCLHSERLSLEPDRSANTQIIS